MHRQRLTGWLTAAMFSACAPAPAPTPVVAVATQTSAMPKPKAVAPEPPKVDDGLPPRIRGPAHAACLVNEDETRHPLTLRRRAGAAPAIKVKAKVRASLSFPKGPAREGAFAEIAGPFGSVVGWLDGDDVKLYAAQPTAFAGYAIPSSSTVLRHSQATAGKLQLTFAPDEQLKPIRPLDSSVACDTLALSPADYHANAPMDAAPLYWGELALGTLPLSDRSGGTAVAEILVGAKGPRHVSVHAVHGAELHVAHYSYSQLAFGWVSAAAVTRLPAKPGVGYGFGGRRGSASGRGGGHWSKRVCEHEVPLLLSTEGEDPVTIGVLAANVPFKTMERSRGSKEPLSSMRLLGKRWLVASAGSSLIVLWESVETCPPPHD